MAIQAGDRIGPYEIAQRIGAGSMGEVYRARDSQLARDVAVKVLPAGFALDQERLARFRREAQVLASLNHPNIAAIYDLEDTAGTCVLVLELVEGPTLAERIAHGPLPVSEALDIAKQLAEALEAAHERGIIHRDLKPANIKIRDDGTVKVLDFGLAKPVAAQSGAAGDGSTATALATSAGVVVGTAAYMSPEQALGRPVDRRTDIWAFGCVVYEMLTGRRLVEGQDFLQILPEVAGSEPVWSGLPPGIPMYVEQHLRRCCRRDPRQRLRDMGDIRLALEGAFEPAERSCRC